MIKPITIAFILFFITVNQVVSQDKFNTEKKENRVDEKIIADLKSTSLNVFLDCRWCDRNYIKLTIPFVNYVNNKDDADVHILVRRRITGGGGGEYNIDFIGQGDFSDVHDALMFYSAVDQTADETRKARSGMIAMGLMQFVARTPIGRNIKISYENKDIPEQMLNTNVLDDPWNSWMFRVRGSGNFSKDENYENTRVNGSLSADRVTPDLKIEFDARYDYRQTIYSYETDKSFRQNWSMHGMIVKSIGPNWAAGGRFSTIGDSYNNYNLSASAGPAIEYNLFPYEESFKRQFRIQYGIGGIYNNYSDTTTYFKTEQMLARHYISISAGFNQQWGSGYFSLTGANYLHDFALNNLGIRGRVNYRIYKGLSVNFETRANLIHDQINLPKGDATTQDVLTKQIALKTGYYYSLEFGLSYSFGSIYNNVVNTRFGN